MGSWCADLTCAARSNSAANQQSHWSHDSSRPWTMTLCATSAPCVEKFKPHMLQWCSGAWIMELRRWRSKALWVGKSCLQGSHRRTGAGAGRSSMEAIRGGRSRGKSSRSIGGGVPVRFPWLIVELETATPTEG